MAMEDIVAIKDDCILMTEKPLSVRDAHDFVVLPSTGASTIFTGTTRDSFDGKKVVRLEYEAYQPMAYKEITKICNVLRERWKISRICIMHRLGHVPVTEISVIIAISSQHRKDALEAVQFAIDELKARVPIWKKEVYADGGGCEWKQNKECFWTLTPKD